MNEELEKVKENIQEGIDANNRYIDNMKYKIGILEKTILNGRFELYPHFLLISIFISLLAAIVGLTTITTSVPFVVGIILGGIPICSIAMERIVYSHYKKKLNQFSSSKTEEEKREEIIDYKIEISKTESKNNALESAYEYVSGRGETQKYLEENSSTLSYEDEEARNNQLSSKVKEVEKQIDIIAQKQVLKKQFSNIRNKRFNKVLNTLCFVTPVLLCGVVGYAISALSSIAALGICALGALSGIGTFANNKWSDNIDMKLFKEFNSQLGDDKLPLYEEEGCEDVSLDDKMCELSYLYSLLEQSDVRLLDMERKAYEEEIANVYKKTENIDYSEVEYDNPTDSKEVAGPSLVKRY